MRRFVPSNHESNFWKSKPVFLVVFLLSLAIVLHIVRMVVPASVEGGDFYSIFYVSITGWTYALHSLPWMLSASAAVILVFLLRKAISDAIRFKFKSVIAVACMFIFSISMINVTDNLNPLFNKDAFAFSQADKKMEKIAMDDERYDTYESFPLFDAEEFLDKTKDSKYEENSIIGVALIQDKSHQENRVMLATSRHQENGSVVQVAYHIFDVVDDKGLDKYRSVLNDIEVPEFSLSYRYKE